MWGIKFLQINWQDLVRGLVVAVIAAILTALLPIVQSGHLPTHAQLIGIGTVALTAAIAYVVKNLLTNSRDQLFVPEPKPADEVKA